jgi:glucose/mannose-6-phosphate isomerase
MEEAIKNFGKQFDYQPVIENESKFEAKDSVVLCGMGGSHLAAGLIKIYNPALDLYIHRDYGLPLLSEKRFAESLFIASSYSGNTEEVLDFAEQARAKKYNLAVVTVGGKLLEFAKKNKIPYIQLPETAIQPRSAIGFSIIALAKLIEGDDAVTELKTLAKKLDVTKWEKTGKDFAQGIRGQIPVIYSSRTNFSIAYNWKIKFNETAKIPAFYNVFPELNHNEMAGFDPIESTKGLSDKFHFIFLDDPSDHPKIMHRAQVTKKLYTDRGLLVTTFQLAGDTVFEKIFNSLILADWIALSVSKMYGTVPDAVPIVEELKKLMI